MRFDGGFIQFKRLVSSNWSKNYDCFTRVCAHFTQSKTDFTQSKNGLELPRNKYDLTIRDGVEAADFNPLGGL